MDEFDSNKSVDLDDTCVIYHDGDIDAALANVPLEILEKLDISPPSTPVSSGLEFSGKEMTDADIDADLRSALDSDAVAPSTPSPATPSPSIVAPKSIFVSQIIPAFQQTLFDSNSFVTKTDPSKAETAFNLLGCIVLMARSPGTVESREAVLNVFGDRPEIIAQLAQYVDDKKSGVVHDPDSRSVVIARSPLYSLVRGENVAVEGDRILTYFGNPGDTSKVKDPSIRNYFSGLKRAWDANRVRGGVNTFLNSFQYIMDPKACGFKFLY